MKTAFVLAALATAAFANQVQELQARWPKSTSTPPVVITTEVSQEGVHP